MKEVSVKDRASFEAEVARILDGFTASRGAGKDYMSDPLFRGQADQYWPLVTTLERFSTKPWSVKSYYRLILAVAPGVNSLTQRTWPLDRDLEVDESYHGPPPGYEFMIYLRQHHGGAAPAAEP